MTPDDLKALVGGSDKEALDALRAKVHRVTTALAGADAVCLSVATALAEEPLTDADRKFPLVKMVLQLRARAERAEAALTVERMDNALRDAADSDDFLFSLDMMTNGERYALSQRLVAALKESQ